MNTPKCNLTSCTLRESCQRFDEAGTWKPEMRFVMPKSCKKQDPLKKLRPYSGPVLGCPDFWQKGTGDEWFMTSAKKTPVSVPKQANS